MNYKIFGDISVSEEYENILNFGIDTSDNTETIITWNIIDDNFTSVPIRITLQLLDQDTGDMTWSYPVILLSRIHNYDFEGINTEFLIQNNANSFTETDGSIEFTVSAGKSVGSFTGGNSSREFSAVIVNDNSLGLSNDNNLTVGTSTGIITLDTLIDSSPVNITNRTSVFVDVTITDTITYLPDEAESPMVANQMSIVDDNDIEKPIGERGVFSFTIAKVTQTYTTNVSSVRYWLSSDTEKTSITTINPSYYSATISETDSSNSVDIKVVFNNVDLDYTSGDGTYEVEFGFTSTNSDGLTSIETFSIPITYTPANNSLTETSLTINGDIETLIGGDHIYTLNNTNGVIVDYPYSDETNQDLLFFESDTNSNIQSLVVSVDSISLGSDVAGIVGNTHSGIDSLTIESKYKDYYTNMFYNDGSSIYLKDDLSGETIFDDNGNSVTLGTANKPSENYIKTTIEVVDSDEVDTTSFSDITNDIKMYGYDEITLNPKDTIITQVGISLFYLRFDKKLPALYKENFDTDGNVDSISSLSFSSDFDNVKNTGYVLAGYGDGNNYPSYLTIHRDGLNNVISKWSYNSGSSKYVVDSDDTYTIEGDINKNTIVERINANEFLYINNSEAIIINVNNLSSSKGKTSANMMSDKTVLFETQLPYINVFVDSNYGNDGVLYMYGMFKLTTGEISFVQMFIDISHIKDYIKGNRSSFQTQINFDTKGYFTNDSRYSNQYYNYNDNHVFIVEGQTEYTIADIKGDINVYRKTITLNKFYKYFTPHHLTHMTQNGFMVTATSNTNSDTDMFFYRDGRSSDSAGKKIYKGNVINSGSFSLPKTYFKKPIVYFDDDNNTMKIHSVSDYKLYNIEYLDSDYYKHTVSGSYNQLTNYIYLNDSSSNEIQLLGSIVGTIDDSDLVGSPVKTSLFTSTSDDTQLSTTYVLNNDYLFDEDNPDDEIKNLKFCFTGNWRLKNLTFNLIIKD
jgi:hypothetical protein